MTPDPEPRPVIPCAWDDACAVARETKARAAFLIGAVTEDWGGAIAGALASRSVRMAFLYDPVHEKQAMRLAATLAARQAIALPLTAPAAAEPEAALVQRVVEDFGRLDLVVHVAGDSTREKVGGQSPADPLPPALDLVRLARAAEPHLHRARPGGVLVVVWGEDVRATGGSSASQAPAVAVGREPSVSFPEAPDRHPLGAIVQSLADEWKQRGSRAAVRGVVVPPQPSPELLERVASLIRNLPGHRTDSGRILGAFSGL